MSKQKFLQKRHQTWYAVVEVPNELRHVLGKRRFLRSLRTQSLDEADRRKHPVITEMKRQIDVLAKAPNQTEVKVLAKAMQYRLDYTAASPRIIRDGNQGREETFSERGFVLDDIRTDWEQLRTMAGPDLAARFLEIATAEATPIAGLPEQWLAELKGHLSEQTIGQHKATVKSFVAWAGGDGLTIEAVNRRKAGDYLTQQLVRSVAAKTAKRHVSSLSSLWKWLQSRGLATENPWEKHKIGGARKSKSRFAFTDASLVKLLSGKSTELYNEYLHDLLRLALVSGARLGELCELKKADVAKREDGWWISIQQGKTEAATRSTPMHEAVESILERRTAGRDPYLFEGLVPGGPDKKRMWYVSKAFGRYRRQLGLTQPLEDFHALRNTFIETMEGAEVPESTVKLLVGHKRESMTFGHYSKGRRVALRDSVNRLSYPEEVMALIRERPASTFLENVSRPRPLAKRTGRKIERKPTTEL
jgi:integrase